MINKFRLNELGTVNRGKSKHRPRNDPDLYGGEYPFIQTGDVKHSSFYVTSHSQSYNDKGLAQSKLWPEGTLCITIAANIADTAILTYSACFPDSIIGFLPNKDKTDIRYVKYCLDTFRLQMKSISQGTTQDNMSVEKLLSIEFPAPELKTQKKIAAILSAYDDLIENNKRRIVLLENMAEEIYREWFVRFRFPGYKTAEFEKGIPKGWGIIALGDIIELAYGKALKADERIDGEYPVYGSSGIVGSHNESLVSGGGVIVGRKGNVGSVFWSKTSFFPIDTVYYAKTSLPNSFVFYVLKSMNFINNDSAVPGLNRNQAYSNKLLLPVENLIDIFAKFIKPLIEQIEILTSSNELLEKTKNSLLLRLISSKLSVENLNIESPPSMKNTEVAS